MIADTTTMTDCIYLCDSCDGTRGAPWDCDGCGGLGFVGEDGLLFGDFEKEAVTPEELEEELRLWRRWKAGDTAALGPLMDRFEPILNKWYGKLSTSSLPASAIRGELELQMIDAFERYDPHRGVKLSTWLENNLRGALRMVYDHANIGRIPEDRSRRISTFNAAKGALAEKLGREPSALELSDELGWNLPEVGRMERELRKDLALSTDFEEMVIATPRLSEAMHWVYRELTGRERAVFEWLTGWGGKPVLAQVEIARRLGVSPATVTNVRKRLVEKVQRAEELV